MAAAVRGGREGRPKQAADNPTDLHNESIRGTTHGGNEIRTAGRDVPATIRYFIDRGPLTGVTITVMKSPILEISTELAKGRRIMQGRMVMLVVALALILALVNRPAAASTQAEAASDTVQEAALQMVKACVDQRTPVDERALATLADYAISSKQTRQFALTKSQGCPGAFLELDTRVTFPRFMEYAYNPSVPAAATRPSSLRYSIWMNPKGGRSVLPGNWRPIPRSGAPLIIYGMQREADSPDIHTGVYHEYDLKRLLVFMNHKGHQVLISVSKQIKTSNVGKKGFTLGNDSDWSYYYSDEPGTTKRGMGWAKSYIYDYFSVGVYVEPAPGQPVVRSAVFQWLRAGWSGMNFVKSSHILNGLRRFAQGFNGVLESPRLPASAQLASAYQSLLQLSTTDLLFKYSLLQQSLRSSAIKMGKMANDEPADSKSFAHLSKEQMAEELMVDYIRAALGKRSALASREFPMAGLIR